LPFCRRPSQAAPSFRQSKHRSSRRRRVLSFWSMVNRSNRARVKMRFDSDGNQRRESGCDEDGENNGQITTLKRAPSRQRLTIRHGLRDREGRRCALATPMLMHCGLAQRPYRSRFVKPKSCSPSPAPAKLAGRARASCQNSLILRGDTLLACRDSLLTGPGSQSKKGCQRRAFGSIPRVSGAPKSQIPCLFSHFVGRRQRGFAQGGAWAEE
jgi:hypothetical protein